MHDIFAFTDIHGMWHLYKAIMNYCHEQDPDAMIIYCGDACDRGPGGYRIMKDLLANPHVVYLKGNHEDMFAKAAREIKEYFSFKDADRDKVKHILKTCMVFDYRYAAIQDSLSNGGLSTLTDWVMDGMPMDFVESIEGLPLTFSTDTCDFCHAAGIYPIFERVAQAEYDSTKIDEWDKESILWSRGALDSAWRPDHTCIFGHTPVPYLLEDLEVEWDETKEVQPYKYVGHFGQERGMTGAKIDMDTGAAFLGFAYVLNVLTMQAQGFKDTDFENPEIRNHDVEKIDVIQF